MKRFLAAAVLLGAGASALLGPNGRAGAELVSGPTVETVDGQVMIRLHVAVVTDQDDRCLSCLSPFPEVSRQDSNLQPSAQAAAGKTAQTARYIAGIGRRPRRPFAWIVFDLEEESSFEVPLDFTPLSFNSGHDPLLYGSGVQDRTGSFYAGGMALGRPVLLRIHRAGSAAPARPPAPDLAAALDSPPERSDRSKEKIWGGSGDDWQNASAEEKQALAGRITDWLHPGLADEARNEWARRYVQELDDLSQRPGAGDGKIADWLPLLHARLVGSQGRGAGGWRKAPP